MKELPLRKDFDGKGKERWLSIKKLNYSFCAQVRNWFYRTFLASPKQHSERVRKIQGGSTKFDTAWYHQNSIKVVVEGCNSGLFYQNSFIRNIPKSCWTTVNYRPLWRNGTRLTSQGRCAPRGQTGCHSPQNSTRKIREHVLDILKHFTFSTVFAKNWIVIGEVNYVK